MPPEALPKLFDPFYRVDESRTRDTGGVGLGLTIVKTLVTTELGGTIDMRQGQPADFAAAGIAEPAVVARRPPAAAVARPLHQRS